MSRQSDNFIPTLSEDRIYSIDVLRGFAVLGILVINIQSFSMISVAYLNPSAFGDLTGANKWVWIISHLLADSKFMTIFSLLFGAGIFLFTEKLEKKELAILNMHYRRIFWLLVFGMMHAYLLWYGDILVAYAVCAMIAILFRKLNPKVLIPLGIFFIAVPSFLYIFVGVSWNFIPPEGQEGILISWRSTPELITKELAAYRDSWISQMDIRIKEAVNLQTFVFLIYIGPRAGGLMLVGMGLYKLGILSALKSNRFYTMALILGLVIGFPLVISGIYNNFAAEWVVNYSMFLGFQFNYWGSLFISFGYLSIIMLISKWEKLRNISGVLAATGRMAFTNYIIQTLICTWIFYGHGLGFFGSVDRTVQIIIVVSIWTLQLFYSPLWLKYFRFGPLEWLWRSLTYWKLQPFMR